MKSRIGFLILIGTIFTVSLFAEPLWQGNAIQGSDDTFSEFYDAMGSHLAASRALPPGTEIKVFNQLNNKWVTATVVTETERPGIFLSLSPAAADEIALERGDMILVNIQKTLSAADNSPFQVYQQNRDEYMSSNSYVDEPIDSVDLDNNPFVRGEGELEALQGTEEDALEELIEEDPIEELIEEDPIEELIEEDPIEELVDEEPVEEIIEEEPIEELVEEEPVLVIHEEYDDIIEGTFSSNEVISLIEPVQFEEDLAGEELFVSNIDEEPVEEDITEPVEEAVEEDITETAEEAVEQIVEEDITELVEDIEEQIAEEETPPADRIIYFLTPAELRPPEIVHVQEEDGDSTVSLIPQEVTDQELQELISIPLERGSRYIQVASYREENLEQVYQEMAQLETLFPMILMPDELNGEKVYRLLVGPATRDEMGVLLRYHLPSQGYSDSMEYKYSE